MTRPPPTGDENPAASRTRPSRIALAIAIVVLIGLVVAAGVGALYWRSGEARQSHPPSTGTALAPAEKPFSLIDPAGRTVTDRDFRGQVMLIYFGYTTCPHHCSTMLSMAAGVLDALGPRARQVRPIFITVDPEHDTPEIMGRYTIQFSPRILGLTGTSAQIESVEKAYGIQTLFRRTGPEVGAYVIDHPSVFYLMGADGRFITELPADLSADDLAAQIQRVL